MERPAECRRRPEAGGVGGAGGGGGLFVKAQVEIESNS